MAPKKRPRTGASSSTAAKPTTPAEILAAYKHRPICQERAMQVPDWFEEYVRSQNWQLFVNGEYIGDGVRSWVCEFYTQLELNPSDKVTVKGKTIDISPAAINKFFKFRTTGDDQYSAFIKTEIDSRAVLTELTGHHQDFPSTWPNFPKQLLTPRCRFLNLWLNARLFPAKSHSSMSRRRALLVYAMSRGLTINIGRVINEEMHATRTPVKITQGIGFPSLITALCKKAGLRAPDDPMQRVALIADLVWKPPEEQGDEQAEEQEEAQAEEQGEEQPQGQDQEASSSEYSYHTQYNKDMEKLFANLTDMMGQQDTIETRQTAIEASQLRQEGRIDAVQQQITDLRIRQDQHYEDVAAFMRYQAEVHAYDFGGRQGPPPVYSPPPHQP